MILPSCGVTLVKRQHRGGYYVSTNPRHQVGKEEAVTKTYENESVASVKPEVVEAEELAVVETPATINEQPNAPDVPAVHKQNETTPAKLDETSSKHQKFSLSSITEKVPMMKKMNSALKKVKVNSPAPRSDDGLSLIWIVILVLLILWAFGLLGGGWGLGGLINVLLVIALILLILWLLRII